ncbi:hypothetical protein MTR67_049796 [Solanum verrucosum]|uniref:Uncharacterized protein n=1 Tax=Solanum verrucosum TaxID=315347 RepID=A0AAF0V437_SOLVR|nr:hypothetical protein MTR67_049796 [Solanum verrucosum]
MVNNVPTAASEPRGEFNQANLKDAAPEAKGSDVSGLQHDLAPMRGFPDASMVEIMASDSSNGQKLGSDQPENPLPPADSSHQRIQPNPCRSVGDALEGWKDRVKVSLDLQESEAPDDLAAENANEYSYTTEFEKGTAQALGPATADQVDKNVQLGWGGVGWGAGRGAGVSPKWVWVFGEDNWGWGEVGGGGGEGGRSFCKWVWVFGEDNWGWGGEGGRCFSKWVWVFGEDNWGWGGVGGGSCGDFIDLICFKKIIWAKIHVSLSHWLLYIFTQNSLSTNRF